MDSLLLRNKRSPSVIASLRGQFYEFRNFEADMPVMPALMLLRDLQYESVEPLPKFNPESWLKDRKLLWNGPFGRSNGFCTFSEQMLLALDKLCDVYAIDTINQSNNEKIAKLQYKPRTLEIFEKNLDRLDLFHIKISLYHDFEPMPIDYTIGYTMFETTRLPNERVPTCNRERRMWVPSDHNVQMFKDSGVTVPIDKLPLGFSDQYYRYVDRPIKKPGEEFVFGTFGGLTRRKGVYELINAFREEFTHDELVRLAIHNVKPLLHGYEYNDPRIEYNLVNWDEEDLVKQFLAKIDCAVFPTKGEGWGLPSIEAAATGVPTIVTNWSGPAEYVNDDFLKLDTTLEPVFDFPPEWGYLGDWAKIDEKQLREHMRWAYENRHEAKAMGKRCSEYLHENWTWDKAAERIVKRLDELAKEYRV